MIQKSSGKGSQRFRFRSNSVGYALSVASNSALGHLVSE